MNIDWPTLFAGIKTVLDPLAEASWPIAIGTCIWVLRTNVRELLSRTKRLNGFGSEAEFRPKDTGSQQQVAASAPKLLPEAEQSTDSPIEHAVYSDMDRTLIEILEKNYPGDIQKQLTWAIRLRSVSEANRIHEMNYRIIFGSQIAALKALNVAVEAPANDFEIYYKAAAENPEWLSAYKDRNFSQWGQYLINCGYVSVVPGSNPERVRITPFGTQFLFWMTDARATEHRAG